MHFLEEGKWSDCMNEVEENNDCLFCKIVEKKIPADIVYESEDIIAFKDIEPKAPIHCLIIPKKHISTINDIDGSNSNIIGLMYEAAAQLARTLNVDKDGYRVVMNCNSNGGQTVYHIHLHFLAGRQLGWPPG
jgi:histidine triad (HIT) family protein